MFHDVFVHWSGMRRAQGTKNETLTDMFHDMCDPAETHNMYVSRYVSLYVCLLVQTKPNQSPDLDGDPSKPV